MRSGVLHKIPQVQIEEEILDESSTQHFSQFKYLLASLLIFIAGYFWRRRQIRKQALKALRIKARKDSTDFSTRSDRGTATTNGSVVVDIAGNGLELGNTPMKRQLPKLRGLPTDKDGTRSTSILSKDLIEKIVQDLPTRYGICDWCLLYSSNRDGYSLKSCVEAARKREPALFVVRDSKNALFGAFLSEPLEKRDGYYGTGETFLIKMLPEYCIYKATGLNAEFICCEKDFMALGGGGKFGLHLDSYLERGISEHSPTFGNEPLSATPNFKVVAVEMWGFVTPY
jgi:hypothetical protein